MTKAKKRDEWRKYGVVMDLSGQHPRWSDRPESETKYMRVIRLLQACNAAREALHEADRMAEEMGIDRDLDLYRLDRELACIVADAGKQEVA